MTNHNGAFPGNPYARSGVHIDGGDLSGVARAIKLLAFEVRTATMLEAAEPRDYSGVPIPVVEGVMRQRLQAFERLGMNPAPPRVDPGADLPTDGASWAGHWEPTE